MSTLGERLKGERERRGWTKVYISKKLGLKTVSTYANWEYGIREPDTEMLTKIGELFEVSTDYLTGRTNSRTGSAADPIVDLEELLSSGKYTIDGKQIPKDLIDDILGYVRIVQAKGKNN